MKENAVGAERERTMHVQGLPESNRRILWDQSKQGLVWFGTAQGERDAKV